MLIIEVSFTPAYNRLSPTFNGLPVADLHKQMAGDGEYFLDNIHPEVNGAKLMAEVTAHDLKK